MDRLLPPTADYIEKVIRVDLADAASADYDIQVGSLLEVIDVEVVKSGAGAGNSVQLKSGANVISDAVAATTDKAVTRAGTIDRAFSTIAPGGVLRLSVVRAAGSAAMRVFIRVLVKPTVN